MGLNFGPVSEPKEWKPTTALCTILILFFFSLGFSSNDGRASDGITFLPRRARLLNADTAPRLLLPRAGTAIATNGRELVAALGNRTVTTIELMSNMVNVAPEDWNSSSVGLPIVLERNVSVEGQPTDWPQLYLIFFKNAVKLKGTVRLMFRYVYVYMDGLLGNTNRLAGTEIFAPTDASGAPGEVWLTTAALYTPYCFPGSFHSLDIEHMPRPAQYPGTQSALVDVVQEGCINATDAPPLLRCWADKAYTQDWAFEGNDLIDGVTIARNLLFRFLNITAVCDIHVDLGCLVQQKDPLLCYVETVNRPRSENKSSISGGGLSDGAQRTTGDASNGADGDAAGGAALASQKTAEAGATRTCGSCNRTAVVVGATVGAVAGLVLFLGAVAATVMLLVVVRRRQRHRLSDNCSNGDPEIAGSGNTVTAAAAASAVAAESSAAARSNEVMEAAAATVATAGQADKAKAAEVPRPVAADVAPPIAPGTPLRSNIPLHVNLVQLQQPPAGYSSRSKSLQAAPPQLTIPAAAVTAARTEAAKAAAGAGPLVAQKSDQHPAVVAVGAPGLQTIDEEAMAANLGSTGGGGCGGGGDAAGAAAGSVGGQHQHQHQPDTQAAAVCADALQANYRFFSDSTSRRDLLHTNEGNGEGCGVVGLLPVVLGKGSFGRVVEGLYLGRRVAVKLMLTDDPFSCCQGEAAASERNGSFTSAFAREVQVLSRCQHPNVVSLLAACVTPPRFCLVMELMDTSLEWLIHHQEVMPLPKVLHIGILIANALAYLHPTITHRDLKPDNVLVNNPHSNRPTVKLTDFGLSRLRMTVASTAQPDAGTPVYMAPECFDVTNRRITHQADIYSLGVLLWEMLSVTKPWKDVGPVAVAFMVAYKDMRLPLASLPSSRCPHKLKRLLQSCWDADPARRPAAAEVAKILTLVLQNVERQDLERSTATPSWGQQ